MSLPRSATTRLPAVHSSAWFGDSYHLMDVPFGSALTGMFGDGWNVIFGRLSISAIY